VLASIIQGDAVNCNTALADWAKVSEKMLFQLRCANQTA